MTRTSSPIVQIAFDLENSSHALCAHPNVFVRAFARATNKGAQSFKRTFGKNHTVTACLCGRSLTVPSEHFLAAILLDFPQYNSPLGFAVQAIRASLGEGADIQVVDVGANVGDTVALIEQYCPGICSYLCIEADEELAKLCASNNEGDSRVQVLQSLIGEDEGALVCLSDDGRANPSTKPAPASPVTEGSGYGRLVRLDTAAGSFARAQGGISLIKIDTEGYDFGVLRSAPEILRTYRPNLYFEWYPKLLAGLNEDVCSGFDYLASFGYENFVFYTNFGDYHCKLTSPDRLSLRSLASITTNFKKVVYFDVFASTSESVCNTLVELSVAPGPVYNA